MTPDEFLPERLLTTHQQFGERLVQVPEAGPEVMVMFGEFLALLLIDLASCAPVDDERSLLLLGRAVGARREHREQLKALERSLPG